MSASIATERPILFSDEMVRAILDGRKTQTRRVLTRQPDSSLDHGKRAVVRFKNTGVDNATRRAVWQSDDIHGQPVNAFRQGAHSVQADVTCPFGSPGVRLWVRETWRAWAIVGAGDIVRAEYAADGATIDRRLDDWYVPLSVSDGKWGRSIHMPRWASRLTLEVTAVRIERVQEISAADAVAEGQSVEKVLTPGNPLRAAAYARGVDVYNDDGEPHPDGPFAGAIQAYAALWDSLNAKRGYGWDVNPWVWVIEFRRAEVQP